MSELQSVFETEVEEVETVEEVSAEEEVAEKVAEPEEAKLEEESKEEETTSEDFKDMPSWAQKAVKDERNKRQELERKLSELQKPKEEVPDVFEDQTGFKDAIRNENQQDLANAKLELAREMMMEFHDDYEEMEVSFIEIARDNPVLLQEAQKAPNQAKFAYEQAKKYKEFKEIQDIGKTKSAMAKKYKEELREELRKELKEEMEKENALSPSLASKTGKNVPEAKALDTIQSLFE